MQGTSNVKECTRDVSLPFTCKTRLLHLTR